MALNEFQNFNIAVSVFDISEGDAAKKNLQEILDKKTIDHVDMVVGPLFSDNFIFFAENFSKNIPIVAPFSKKTHLTDINENIFQVQPNIEHQLATLSNFILENHYGDNMLFVYRDTIFESKYVKDQQTQENQHVVDTLLPTDINYANRLLANLDTSELLVQHVKINSHIIDSIHHKLDTLGMKNVVVIPSDDNVFVNDLLSKLHACRDTSLVVYGLPSLYDLNHISIYDLMDMNLTFPHHKLENNTILVDFIIKFYDQYHYYPNINYASIGYEVGVFFIEMLINNKSISHVIKQDPKIILQRIYDFEKYNKGYKNDGVLILKYHNFGYLRMD